jgi:hypothetical protein
MRSATPTAREPNVILRFRLNLRDGAAGAVRLAVFARANSIAMPRQDE